MKRMIKNNGAGFAALILGVVLAVGTSAFRPAEKVAKRANQYWRFDANNLSDAKTAAHYTLVTGSIPSCDDEPELPCILEVAESVDTQAELQSYLNTFADGDAVRQSAYAQKAIQ